MEQFLAASATTALGLNGTVEATELNWFTNESQPEEEYFDDDEEGTWTLAKIQRVATLATLMVVSLVGNLVIILVLTCSRFHKHLSRVNIFIVNLAVGDLAVCCITIPSELVVEILDDWIFGPYGCKLIMYIQIAALSSTTYLLMSMSFDRYQAICRPLDFNPSRSKAAKIVTFAWVAAAISALPYFFIYLQVETGYFHLDGTAKHACNSVGYSEGWMKKVNFIWLTLTCYLIPALWIAFCYFNVARVVWQQGNFQKMETVHGVTLLRKTCDHRVIPRAKIKTMKMSLTIVLAFICLWTPYFVVYNIMIFSDYSTKIPKFVLALVETLGLINSAVNPIIYGFFNLRIRQGMHEVFKGCCSPHSDKSRRTSEPTISTSSAVIFKGFRRSPPQLPSWAKRRGIPKPGQEIEGGCPGGYDFAQSTRHIQKKRSQLQTLQRLKGENLSSSSTPLGHSSSGSHRINSRPMTTFRIRSSTPKSNNHNPIQTTVVQTIPTSTTPHQQQSNVLVTSSVICHSPADPVTLPHCV